MYGSEALELIRHHRLPGRLRGPQSSRSLWVEGDSFNVEIVDYH
jgi:hypothetical protein